ASGASSAERHSSWRSGSGGSRTSSSGGSRGSSGAGGGGGAGASGGSSGSGVSGSGTWLAQSNEKGGYSSMSSSRYASTRTSHCSAPTPNSYSPLGYRPLMTIAIQATTVVIQKAIIRNTSTMKCGMARKIRNPTARRSRARSGST